MSDDKDSKKILAIRTFASDIARVRGINKDIQTEPPAVNISKNKTLPPIGQKQIPKPVHEKKEHDEQSHIPIPVAVTNNTSSNDDAEEPVIPPFHFIRESSPDETVYDDDNAIPDKKSLTKEVIKPTTPTPPPKLTTPLSVEIENINVPNQQNSLHTNKDEIFDAEEAVSLGEGTIITDHKHNRFKLFPAILSALKKWFGTKQAEIKDSQKPKHTIVKASKRKEVIKAAGNKATHVPINDYQKTTERLQKVKRITATETLHIRDEVDVPPPTWQTIDENNKATTDLPDKVTNEEKQTKSNTEQKLTTESALSNKTVESESPTVINSDTKEGYSKYRESYGEDFNPTEDTFSETITPTENTPPTEENVPKYNTSPVPEYRLNRQGKPVLKTKGTPYLTLAAVIMVAVILGIGTSVWWFTTHKTTPTTVTETNSNQTITDVQSINQVALTGSKEGLFVALNKIIKFNNNGLTEIKITTGNTLATAQNIFDTMQPNAPGSFLRAITGITFGANDTNPFIILKFNSFDTVFGGILIWEKNMSQDLDPLFGAGEITTASDDRINNQDIRALVGTDQIDKITYGFIDKHTILITTDRQAYANLVLKIK